MTSKLCQQLGIEFPLFAFSHCRDVVAAVSKAGGFGVLGATAFNPEQLAIELDWIDAHVDGKPYGLDVLIPENMAVKSEKDLTSKKLAERIPQGHKDFVDQLLKAHGVEGAGDHARARSDDAPPPFWPEEAMELLEVAFKHPIKMIINALGVPPPAMIQMGRDHGVPVAALAGAKEHALRLAAAGVDIIVAQGGEAGGHCGEVSTLVLIPEVVRALKSEGYDCPVLAAGGIMTGEQMAACMAMGAAGAWTGSVWLATLESETSQIFREKMVDARSRDTVRSKGRTGKYSRQLKSAWTDAWEGPESPGALPMPMQSLIAEPAIHRATKAAEGGNAKARELVTYFVGQGVGLVSNITSARSVVQDFMQDYATAVETLNAAFE
ncbi:MAG: nitronate monooxygenase [Sphingomonadales bacterium]|nr:nitronate monooxygenase [Sphingomonadales bacterium]MBK6492593.1 nitronate monooxygenase [Sphingomonadales bacterium]MBL0001923.1 nitronate monooxygenase [Sphingomonadales bacterium]MBP7135834.1 nitronate monooxygenase [Sphingomonadaceae bacterium]